MTKRHFIALADTIKTSDTLFLPTHIYILANFCASQNSNFNRELWLAYINGECGPNGGTIKPPTMPRPVTPKRKLARRLEGK